MEGALSAGLALLHISDAKARLLDLAVFPLDASVPIGLVTKLWSDRSGRDEAEAASLCSRMANLSFFAIADGYVQLHDVMHEYLRRQVGESTQAMLAGLLLDLLSKTLPPATSCEQDENGTPEAWWEEGVFAQYISENVVRHMMDAGRQQDAEVLVCDLRWVLRRAADRRSHRSARRSRQGGQRPGR